MCIRQFSRNFGMIDSIFMLQLMMDTQPVFLQYIAPCAFGNDRYIIARPAQRMHQQRTDHAAAVNQYSHNISSFLTSV